LVGQSAPSFSLPNQYGIPTGLDDGTGAPVLLVFLPFAFSPVCTTEVIDLRDAADLSASADVRTLVVTCDSMYTLQAWGDERQYRGELLSDFWPHGEVSRAYDVFSTDAGRAERGTFLIDADGVVRWAVVNPSDKARSLDDYRAALADLA